jgi:hypothetical protein
MKTTKNKMDFVIFVSLVVFVSARRPWPMTTVESYGS